MSLSVPLGSDPLSPAGLPLPQLVKLAVAVPWFIAQMENAGMSILGTPEQGYIWRDLSGLKHSPVRFDSFGAAMADYCSDLGRLMELAAQWVKEAHSEVC